MTELELWYYIIWFFYMAWVADMGERMWKELESDYIGVSGNTIIGMDDII